MTGIFMSLSSLMYFRQSRVFRANRLIEYDLEDSNYAVHHDIVMHGVYSYTRSGRKTFEGTLYISDLTMSPDMRAKMTFADSIGEITFYDTAGQLITTPVYQVVIDPDGHPVVIKLFDQYKNTGETVQGLFYGRRFICAETLSRAAAIEYLAKINGTQE